MGRALLSRCGTWLVTVGAIVCYAVAALFSAAMLTACGGGDDQGDDHTCYVEGKPMPPEACR